MSSAVSAVSQPNPGVIFDAINAYQKTAAVRAAIDLDLFTIIASGANTVAAIAQAAKAPERGVRIVCDFLTIQGLLKKTGEEYANTIDTELFLNRKSPAYFGNAVGLLLHPTIMAPFANLTDIVRKGRTTLPDEGTVSDNNPVWVTFAEDMAAMQFGGADEIGDIVAGSGPLKVLDIAAGHGLFGIAVAQKNPQAEITALDWQNVLAVARRNAEKAGVADRIQLLAGSAFDVDFGGPYDLVLLTNFLHHFDKPTCESLLKKINAALKPGGRCATLDFVTNDDRISPPIPGSFALIMLGTTASGDVYTYKMYDEMFRNAGFAKTELRTLDKSPAQLLLSTKS